MATLYTSQQSDYGHVTDQVGLKASVKALFESRKRMLWYRFAMEEDMPKGESTTLNFRRWLNIDPVLTPIQGANTPDPANLGYSDIQATIRQYGIWIPQNKHIHDTVKDPVLSRAINALSYNMKLTYETLGFNVLRKGANVFYPDNTSSLVRSDVGTGAGDGKISLNLVQTVSEYLLGENVEPIHEIIMPKTLEGTKPVEECFIAVAHTNLNRSIRAIPGFQHSSEYPSQETVLPGELGRVDDVRFVTHNVCQPWLGAGAPNTSVKNTGGNADVYPVLIFGKEAFGCTKLKGSEFNKIMVANAEVSSSDPLAQRGTAGWTGWNVFKILEDKYMARMEVTSPK